MATIVGVTKPQMDDYASFDRTLDTCVQKLVSSSSL